MSETTREQALDALVNRFEAAVTKKESPRGIIFQVLGISVPVVIAIITAFVSIRGEITAFREQITSQGRQIERVVDVVDKHVTRQDVHSPLKVRVDTMDERIRRLEDMILTPKRGQ